MRSSADAQLSHISQRVCKRQTPGEVYKSNDHVKKSRDATASDSTILDEAVKQTYYLFKDQVRHQVVEWTYQCCNDAAKYFFANERKL